MVKNIIWILVGVALLIGAHAGIKYNIPRYHHSRLESDLKDMLQFPISTEEDVRKYIIKLANEDDVPLDPETGIIIDFETPESFFFKVKWSEHVDYFGKYPKEFDYEISIKK